MSDKTFTILNMMGGDYYFEVHAPGCSDIKRKRINGSWSSTRPSVEACVAEEVLDFQAQDQGYEAHDFHILPCCSKV